MSNVDSQEQSEFKHFLHAVATDQKLRDSSSAENLPSVNPETANDDQNVQQDQNPASEEKKDALQKSVKINTDVLGTRKTQKKIKKLSQAMAINKLIKKNRTKSEPNIIIITIPDLKLNAGREYIEYLDKMSADLENVLLIKSPCSYISIYL